MSDGHDPTFAGVPERLRGLEELALNLWWSWHPAARMLFKSLDRQGWKESRHNPVKMLKELPSEIFEAAVDDDVYLAHYDAVMTVFREEMDADVMCLEEHGDPRTCTIAYFSAEYGLHHSLPFYAGGLGFLAGDFLKECSDLKMPLTAVGFMYPEGYLRQFMRDDGWQEHHDARLDRDVASISRVLDDEGRQVVVEVPCADPPVHVAVWKIAVGRVPLYLMDTDIEVNDPGNRRITEHLYTGDLEQRLRQEIVLGVGGYRVLKALGITPSIVHLNEGHSAFALVERMREAVDAGMSPEEAMEYVRRTSVFTTHTPVPAGHDVFPVDLMERYFSSYWAPCGMNREEFFRLGMHPDEPTRGFNMTVCALRMSGRCNGVSRRHGEVARRMWQGIWPDRAEREIPIGHVTNGVHVPSWIEPKMEMLFNRYLGDRWLQDHDMPSIWQRIGDIPDEELWKTHYWLKTKLVNAIRDQARRRWTYEHGSFVAAVTGGGFLDPSVLTVGFARRFATYKRAALILYDPQRLEGLVNDRWRPIQIIFAGKAHPEDEPGKRLLQHVFNAASDPRFGGRIAFVEDYDEQLAQYMVHGVDVWLNNPLPPLEASGTSGMKASLNGVPHLSILDGWWIEGFNGKNGWGVPHQVVDGNEDDADARALYDLLETEIIPRYYAFSPGGIPYEWVKVMKEAIRSNAAAFSARRMVKEYVATCYRPALEEH